MMDIVMKPLQTDMALFESMSYRPGDPLDRSGREMLAIENAAMA